MPQGFVGETLIEALIDAGMVLDPGDLYTVDPDEAAKLLIGGRVAGGTATKAFKNLHKKKQLDLANLLVKELSIARSHPEEKIISSMIFVHCDVDFLCPNSVFSQN